jgi:hypothetical protein
MVDNTAIFMRFRKGRQGIGCQTGRDKGRRGKKGFPALTGHKHEVLMNKNENRKKVNWLIGDQFIS